MTTTRLLLVQFPNFRFAVPTLDLVQASTIAVAADFMNNEKGKPAVRARPPGSLRRKPSSRWAGRGHRHRRAGRVAGTGRRGVPRAPEGGACRGLRCGLQQLAVGGARPLGHRARGAGRGQRRERGFTAGEARTPEVRKTTVGSRRAGRGHRRSRGGR